MQQLLQILNASHSTIDVPIDHSTHYGLYTYSLREHRGTCYGNDTECFVVNNPKRPTNLLVNFNQTDFKTNATNIQFSFIYRPELYYSTDFSFFLFFGISNNILYTIINQRHGEMWSSSIKAVKWCKVSYGRVLLRFCKIEKNRGARRSRPFLRRNSEASRSSATP